MEVLVFFSLFFFLPFSGPSGEMVGAKAPYALSFYTKVAELTGEGLVMMSFMHKDSYLHDKIRSHTLRSWLEKETSSNRLGCFLGGAPQNTRS